MNLASNIMVILPTLKAESGLSDFPRFCKDFDDKVAGLVHGTPLVNLKNRLAGRPVHETKVVPSFLSVPGLQRQKPDESKGSKGGSIISPTKMTGGKEGETSQDSDQEFYWQLSKESQELDEYMFGQLVTAVEGPAKTYLDSVGHRSYIEGMLVLHNLERLSRVMDLLGMWEKFMDIKFEGHTTEWHTTVLSSWNDFRSRKVQPEMFFMLQVYTGQWGHAHASPPLLI